MKSPGSDHTSHKAADSESRRARLKTTGMNYETHVVEPTALSKMAIERCVSLVNEGGALAARFGASQLRQSRHVCLVRNDDEIVGVGIIKPPRPWYASGIARRSGFDFDSNMLELGYVSRSRNHRGHGLSQKIVSNLIAVLPRMPLFATTSNEKMKQTLRENRFVQQGKQWQGKNKNRLSLWVRRGEC
jgi:predicted GNAT family N-acyltransferase